MYVPTPDNLDVQTLTPLVQAALASNMAAVKSWQVTPILQGRASPAGVYRIAGTAREQDQQVPWSVILKVVESSATSAFAGNNASDDPTHTFYWKREVLLYQSGLFAQLPAGLTAPAVIGSTTYPTKGASGWRIYVKKSARFGR